MRYNTVLVEVLITSILVCAAYLSYRLFKAERDSELGVSGGADLSNLEGLLQSVIEKANLVPTGGGSGDNAASEKLAEQISTLKIELEKKQSEIENMKGAAGAQAEGGGMTADEKKNLEAQMLELQRKLEEYDIIAQDIADLSFYKEENQRLQRELESKGGASKAAATAPTPASAVAAETVIGTKAPIEAKPSPETSIMPSAVEEKPEGKVLNMETRTESPAAPEVNSPEVSIPAAAIDDIVTSVATEKTPDLQEGPISDADMAQFSAEVVKQTASTQPEADNFINDDLMKDWESTVAEQEKSGALAEPDILQASKPAAVSVPASESNPLEGSMDLDKMAQEAGGLLETQTDSAPSMDPSSHELDPEKLAAEADKLVASSGGIKNDMDEFQKFISKDKGR